MTEKDELVEVAKRAYDEASLDDSGICSNLGIVAAIASIRPTIERETRENMLRHMYHFFNGNSSDVNIYAINMGLDLTQDAKGDHNE